MDKKVEVIFLFIFLLCNKILFFAETDVRNDNKILSINEIAKVLDLKIKYDERDGRIVLISNKKRVILLLNSDYILLGEKLFFIATFIHKEQGFYYIDKKIALMIIRYFSIEKYELYVKARANNDEYRKSNENKQMFLNIKQELFENKGDKSDISNIVKDTELKNNNDNQIKSNIYITKNRPKDIKIKAIIIDPGHGGKDPGAIGYQGIREKDIVLKVGLILKEKLKNKFKDIKIILTRDKDIFIPLDKRAKIANYVYGKYGNSIFISIHVNASRSSKPYGFETWYLVSKQQRQIIKEGQVSNDKDVEKVLNAMLNDEIYKESKYLANNIENNLEKSIGYVSVKRGIKEESYFVIRNSIMPAILVEIGFNTNKYEAIRLTKYDYLNKIATGILKGIEEYVINYENTKGFTR